MIHFRRAKTHKKQMQRKKKNLHIRRWRVTVSASWDQKWSPLKDLVWSQTPHPSEELCMWTVGPDDQTFISGDLSSAQLSLSGLDSREEQEEEGVCRVCAGWGRCRPLFRQQHTLETVSGSWRKTLTTESVRFVVGGGDFHNERCRQRHAYASHEKHWQQGYLRTAAIWI